jgi:hypothetical protein
MILLSPARIACVAMLLLACRCFGADAQPSSPLHDQIVQEYLDGNADQAESDLASLGKRPVASKSGGEPDDLDSIRHALAECHPTWWTQVKAGKKLVFRPMVFGKSLPVTYDPAGKVGIQLNYLNNNASVTVTWPADEMDSPAKAEHGFTKGELNDLFIWQNLSTAFSWTTIPLRSQMNMTEDAKQLFSRYLEFRANVGGDYYTLPRARRWAIWLQCAAYLNEYAKMQGVMSRKAVAAMVIAEIVGHRERYPSIQIPGGMPEDGIEAAIADQLRHWLEKHPLTLAEDRALRDAVKAFAAANTDSVRVSGIVKLPNGLTADLDPEKDKDLSPKRDAWLAAQKSK